MSAALAEWLAELCTPLEIPDFEPDIDDKDAKKDAALRYRHRACNVPSMPGTAALLSAGIHVVQSVMLCREQDAIESGLIRKVVLRKSDTGVIPADGDLVCWCWLPKRPKSHSSSKCMSPLSCRLHSHVSTSACAHSEHRYQCITGTGCCPAPQVYVHYNVKTAEGKLLQSTWQAEGGAGLPLPFIIGAGHRAPRAWEIALLSALNEPAACCMCPAVLRIVPYHANQRHQRTLVWICNSVGLKLQFAACHDTTPVDGPAEAAGIAPAQTPGWAS